MKRRTAVPEVEQLGIGFEGIEVIEVPDVATPYEGEMDDDADPPKPLWQRLASLVIPIGLVLYILISALANRDGG